MSKPTELEKLLCDHEPRAIFFGISNQVLTCQKCKIKLRLSDNEYRDWMFLGNLYRDPDKQWIYNFVEVEDE